MMPGQVPQATRVERHSSTSLLLPSATKATKRQETAHTGVMKMMNPAQWPHRRILRAVGYSHADPSGLVSWETCRDSEPIQLAAYQGSRIAPYATLDNAHELISWLLMRYLVRAGRLRLGASGRLDQCEHASSGCVRSQERVSHDNRRI